MADVAVVFHWPVETLRGMEIEELLEWTELALKRLEKLH